MQIARRQLVLPPGLSAYSPSLILGRSAVAVSCPADTTEDTLATITVPANAMGPNGFVRVSARWSFNNNANSKTARIRFSGIGGTIYYSAVSTTDVGVNAVRLIANRGATNSQTGWAVSNSGSYDRNLSAPDGTSAVDTTAATTIVITGQKAVAGDTMTLESYLVELLADGS